MKGAVRLVPVGQVGYRSLLNRTTTKGLGESYHEDHVQQTIKLHVFENETIG